MVLALILFLSDQVPDFGEAQFEIMLFFNVFFSRVSSREGPVAEEADEANFQVSRQNVFEYISTIWRVIATL